MLRLTPICVLATLVVLALPAGAGASYSHGTHEQIAWVRSAALRFVNAELSGDGSGACAVLEGRLRTTRHGRTCEQRWDAKSHALLRDAAERRRLRVLKRAIPTAAVEVYGHLAWIHLRTALMDGPNRFRWTENCWMLES